MPADASALRDADETTPPADARRPRLLIVDDIEDNRTVLKRRFERRSFDVVEADNGLKAIELARGGNFDAVLLDVMMPDIDGLETLRRLRADEATATLPVIMVMAPTITSPSPSISRLRWRASTPRSRASAPKTRPARPARRCGNSIPSWKAAWPSAPGDCSRPTRN
jgi:CheY-like chemotaxis protein